MLSALPMEHAFCHIDDLMRCCATRKFQLSRLSFHPGMIPSELSCHASFSLPQMIARLVPVNACEEGARKRGGRMTCTSTHDCTRNDDPFVAPPVGARRRQPCLLNCRHGTASRQTSSETEESPRNERKKALMLPLPASHCRAPE
jgi:hypothetical protein